MLKLNKNKEKITMHPKKKTPSLFKKIDEKTTMSFSIDVSLRETLLKIAKREGISVSSVIRQTIRLAIKNKLINT